MLRDEARQLPEEEKETGEKLEEGRRNLGLPRHDRSNPVICLGVCASDTGGLLTSAADSNPRLPAWKNQMQTMWQHVYAFLAS